MTVSYGFQNVPILQTMHIFALFQLNTTNVALQGNVRFQVKSILLRETGFFFFRPESTHASHQQLSHDCMTNGSCDQSIENTRYYCIYILLRTQSALHQNNGHPCLLGPHRILWQPPPGHLWPGHPGPPPVLPPADGAMGESGYHDRGQVWSHIVSSGPLVIILASMLYTLIV